MGTTMTPPEVVGIESKPCEACGAQLVTLMVANRTRNLVPVVTWDAAMPVTEKQLGKRFMAHKTDERPLNAQLTVTICANCDLTRWLTHPVLHEETN